MHVKRRNAAMPAQNCRPATAPGGREYFNGLLGDEIHCYRTAGYIRIVRCRLSRLSPEL